MIDIFVEKTRVVEELRSFENCFDKDQIKLSLGSMIKVKFTGYGNFWK